MAVQNCFCTFLTPTSFVQFDEITPIVSEGIDAVEMDYETADGIFVLIWFSTSFAYPTGWDWQDGNYGQGGCVAHTQMQELSGQVWNHESYEDNSGKYGGQTKARTGDYIEVFIPKSADLSPRRVISVYAYGEQE